MSSIIKTRTQGFRVSTFRNQEVHKYYNHLQSVMRSIDSNGTYSDLFAKPEIDAMAVGETEIEWTCSSSSKAVHLSQLSDAERDRIEKFISDAYSHIDAYIAENRTKSGKNRDYAQFLSIVGKRPDPNQVWVVNGKPVIVQWGFVDENGLMGSSGIYSDWDSFIKDIKKAEPEKPKEEPVKVVEEPAEPEKVNEAVVAAPVAASTLFAEQEKPAEPAPQPKPEEPKAKPAEKKEEPKTPPKKVDTEEKKTVYAGLGSYEWVKWVAILLAIIILLLLLLRLLFPPRFPSDLLGQNGTNIGAVNGGGMGGSGGGSDGGGAGGGDNGGGAGGGNGAGDGNGAGGQGGGQGGPAGVNPSEPCPVCSKPFMKHGPEDYKDCILKASKGGAGNGGAGQQGGAGASNGNGGAGNGEAGASNGGGQPGGANGASGNGEGSGSPSGSGQEGAGQGSSGASNGGGQPDGANGAGGNSEGSGSPSGSGQEGAGQGSPGASDGGGQPGSANGAGGNGEGSGSPSGSDQNGITGGAGQGSNGGKPSGQGGSDENAVESSKQQKDDDKGFNPEDICPVCSRQFLLHNEEDLKNCILASQRDKAEVQKKFERLKSATTNYNKAVKELNSENSADKIGE